MLFIYQGVFRVWHVCKLTSITSTQLAQPPSIKIDCTFRAASHSFCALEESKCEEARPLRSKRAIFIATFTTAFYRKSACTHAYVKPGLCTRVWCIAFLAKTSLQIVSTCEPVVLYEIGAVKQASVLLFWKRQSRRRAKGSMLFDVHSKQMARYCTDDRRMIVYYFSRMYLYNYSSIASIFKYFSGPHVGRYEATAYDPSCFVGGDLTSHTTYEWSSHRPRFQT